MYVKGLYIFFVSIAYLENIEKSMEENKPATMSEMAVHVGNISSCKQDGGACVRGGGVSRRGKLSGHCSDVQWEP